MGKGRDKRKKNSKKDGDKEELKRERQLKKAKKHEERQFRKELMSGDAGQDQGNSIAEADVATQLATMGFDDSSLKTEEIQSARASGTLTAHPYLEKTDMLFFGGEFFDGRTTKTYDSLFRYNVQTNSWREILPIDPSTKAIAPDTLPGRMHFTSSAPSARSGHAAVCLSHLGSVIFFGGEYVSPNHKIFQHFSDTWQLIVDKQSIQKSLQCESEGRSVTCYSWARLDNAKHMKRKPSARSGHRMAAWNSKVILFGGFYDIDASASARYYNDLWVLENIGVDTQPEWRLLDDGGDSGVLTYNRPAPRSGHCLCVQNDTVFVFGGYSVHYPNLTHKNAASGKTVGAGIPILHNDLWKYNLQTGVWSVVKTDLGIPPSPRSGLTMVTHPTKGKSYLFGGVKDEPGPASSKRSNSRFYNELYIFDHQTQRFFPQKMKWIKTEPRPSEDADKPNLRNWYPMEPKKGAQSTGVIPCERFNAMLCVLGNNKLYILGGQREIADREFTFSDLYCLDLNTRSHFELLIDMDISKQTWYGKEADEDSEWATTVGGGDTSMHSSSDDGEAESSEAHSPRENIKMCTKEFSIDQPDATPKLTLGALQEHNESQNETGRRRRVSFQL
ncbi:hypothetical protein XU18_1057 [Perkinsela sp. CCAP 1560/4]|nr:hypothetical protein XU18_1057 [Perkinsela sp. CCAP 1560/4]|eukprot:KNH08488.1 hypothetical protein XU18_1057 [Perkinsela sp. CCAP 1560/4]